MITLNILRCLSPWIDYFAVASVISVAVYAHIHSVVSATLPWAEVSLMGSLELFHLYHHFIILHDAADPEKVDIGR